MIVLVGFYGILLFNLKRINDTSPGYKNGVVVMRLIIPELEKLNIYNEKIYAPFLIRENIGSYSLGYRSTHTKFIQLLINTDYSAFAVVNNFEDDDIRNSILNSAEWVLIKEYKVNGAYSGIYRRKSEPESAGE